MANNRLYLCCIKCLQDETKELSDCIFFMFKYYPITGWYINTNRNDDDNKKKIEFFDKIAQFLDTHDHKSMFGEFISIFGTQFDSVFINKQTINEIIQPIIDKLNA